MPQSTIHWRQELSNYMLKHPADFHFYLIAAIVAFILTAIGFRVVSRLKIGFGTPENPQNLIEMEFDAKKHIQQLLIIMMDLT